MTFKVISEIEKLINTHERKKGKFKHNSFIQRYTKVYWNISMYIFLIFKTKTGIIFYIPFWLNRIFKGISWPFGTSLSILQYYF